MPVVHYNYYRQHRLLDLQDILPGQVSTFWHGVLRTANAFKLGPRLRYGQGISVKFWKDCWICETPLAFSFPSLFEMVSDKDAWINSQIQDNRPSPFVIPLPDKTPNVGNPYMYPSRPLVSRCSKPSILESKSISHFHSPLAISVITASTATGQSNQEPLEGGFATQNKNYHIIGGI